jgi:hypothetical protein
MARTPFPGEPFHLEDLENIGISNLDQPDFGDSEAGKVMKICFSYLCFHQARLMSQHGHIVDESLNDVRLPARSDLADSKMFCIWVITFVQNVHNSLINSSTGGLVQKATIRVTQGWVTPGYRATSAPKYPAFEQ